MSGPKKDENNENSTVDGTTDQANTQTKPEKQAKRPPDLKQPIKVEVSKCMYLSSDDVFFH